MFPTRWRCGASYALAVLVMAGVLSGCGGGGGNAPAQAQRTAGKATVARVDGRAPSGPDLAVASIKSRALREVPVAASVVLGPLAVEKMAAAGTGPALQVGAARAADRTATAQRLQALWSWQPKAGGGQVAAVSFSAEGAFGLRLGVHVQALPFGAVVRVYPTARPETVYEASGQQILQLLQHNAEAGDRGEDAETWWSPEIPADAVTLEVEVPAGTPTGSVALAVPRVSHIYAALEAVTAEAAEKAIGDAASCQQDAQCETLLANERGAIARMVFTKAGGTYICTGTLLNTRSSSELPYMLSANHCISSQTVASTLQTDWRFGSTSCTNRALNSASTTRRGGARLLVASASTDTAFLLLNDPAPLVAYFAGWDAGTAPTVGLAVHSLHHPRGDLLKISSGNVAGFYQCGVSDASGSYDCFRGSSTAAFIAVDWRVGSTEPGSSGGPLFKIENGVPYVIGNLRGGGSNCSASTGVSDYGRFDQAFAASLKTWLEDGQAAPPRKPVYRFYNSQSGAHFFTADAAERDYVIATYPTFKFEGVAFHAHAAAQTGTSGVHRFYNSRSGAHFYTVSTAERDQVQHTLPDFKYEGIAWHARSAEGQGAIPLYRFYRPSSFNHFYTVNLAERDFIRANYPSYLYEGVAYHAWSAP